MTWLQSAPYFYVSDEQLLLQSQSLLYQTGTDPYENIVSDPYPSQQGLIPNGDWLVCAAIVTFSAIKKLTRDARVYKRDKDVLQSIEWEMKFRNAVSDPVREYDDKGDPKHGLYYQADSAGRPATLKSYTWGFEDGVSVNFGYGGAVHNFEFHDMGVKIESMSHLLSSRKPRRFVVNHNPHKSKMDALKDMRRAARGLTYCQRQLVRQPNGNERYEANSVDFISRWGSYWQIDRIQDQPPGYRRISMSDHRF